MTTNREKQICSKKIALFFSVFFIWFALMFSPLFEELNDSGNLGFVTQEVSAQTPQEEITRARENQKTNDSATVKEPGMLDLPGKLMSAIGYGIVSLGGLLTWAGGKLLETTIVLFVTGFGALISGGAVTGLESSNLNQVISTIWTLVRDVSNLIFIFGFLYIGILLIYNADSSSARKNLAGLIVAALLVNFSLFITKFVIEFFNLLAYNIYSQMTNEGATTLTGAIMNILGLTSLYDVTDTDFLREMTAGGTLWFFTMAFIFMIVTAFVFFSGALMLLVRFVVLLFIMMFSPVLFAATVFPQTASYAKKMWRYLFDYSIFAPAYLFLLFVAISVLGGLNLAGDTNFSDLPDQMIGGVDSGGNAVIQFDAYMVVLNFVVAIIVIQYAGSLAKKMGLAGGDLAISIANKGKKVAAAATVGVAARAGRASLGKMAHNFAEKESVKEAASRRGWRGTLARGALKGSRSVADSSFDVRNNLSKETAKKLGIGGAGKGGYKTRLETMKKKEEEFAKSLGTLEDTDGRVRGRKLEMEQSEKELRDLKADQALAETKEERRNIAQKIYEKEKEISEKKREYEQEKQRRQIGTTYHEYKTGADKKQAFGNQVDIDIVKGELKEEWATYQEKYKGRSTDENLRALERVEEKEKELKKLRELERTLINERTKLGGGYASVLETAGKLGSWIKGQQVSQRRASGKLLRKARMKGLPKEKEEKRSDDEASKKEDDTK